VGLVYNKPTANAGADGSTLLPVLCLLPCIDWCVIACVLDGLQMRSLVRCTGRQWAQTLLLLLLLLLLGLLLARP
jgi:hypothetical protein